MVGAHILQNDALERVAEGKQSLADFVGLTSDELTEILRFALAKMECGRQKEALRVLQGLVELMQKVPTA